MWFFTRAVRKVSSHFEYPENRSRGLVAIWHPFRGDLIAHPWIVTPVGLVSRQWDAVDWAYVPRDRRIHSDRANRSATLWQCACQFCSSHAGFFWQNITSPRPVNPYTAQICLPATSGFSESWNHRWKWDLLMRWSHTTQAQSSKSHWRVTVYGCTVRSPLTGCQVTSRPRDRFLRYSKWTDNFRTALVLRCNLFVLTVRVDFFWIVDPGSLSVCIDSYSSQLCSIRYRFGHISELCHLCVWFLITSDCCSIVS